MQTKSTKIRFKVGDQVKILAGKDRGKKGKITQVIPAMNGVVVEGLNKMVKHIKKQKADQKGQRIEFDAPVATSKIQLICPNCSKPTRIGHLVPKEKDAKKVRTCVKCKKPL